MCSTVHRATSRHAHTNVLIAPLMLVSWLLAPASTVAQTIVVGAFSQGEPSGIPEGWEPLRFPSVSEETAYGLHETDGRVALRAHSHRAASALARQIAVDLNTHAHLSWSWKNEPTCFTGDWGQPSEDDFPVRLFVLFERPRGLFSFFKKLGSHLSGDLFGNAIMYVPEPAPIPSEDKNSHLSSRIKVVSLSGSTDPPHPGWVQHSRNVYADYVELFGRAPTRVRAVAVMTDTDNSATECASCFGDIFFSATPNDGV